MGLNENYKIGLFLIFVLLMVSFEDVISGLCLLILILFFIFNDLRTGFIGSNITDRGKIRILYLLRIIHKILVILLAISINPSLLALFAVPSLQLKIFLAIIWTILMGPVILPFLFLRDKWNLQNQVPTDP